MRNSLIHFFRITLVIIFLSAAGDDLVPNAPNRFKLYELSFYVSQNNSFFYFIIRPKLTGFFGNNYFYFVQGSLSRALTNCSPSKIHKPCQLPNQICPLLSSRILSVTLEVKPSSVVNCLKLLPSYR